MFHEILFPIDISYGCQSASGFSTGIIEGDGGSEQRVIRWSTPRRLYNVKYGVRKWVQMKALHDFWIGRMGRAYGFRFRDPADFSTAADHQSAPTNADQILGVGDGTRTVFQLSKQYISGPATINRSITKPVAGSVLIAVNGSGTSAFSVDTTTGLATMNSPPPNAAVLTWGGLHDVPVRFGDVSDEALAIRQDSFDRWTLPDIPLIEIRDGLMSAGSFNFGGAAEIVMNGNYSLPLNFIRGLAVAPQSAGLKILLPPTATANLGGPYFAIFNDGPNSVGIANSAGTAIDGSPLAVGASVEMWLSKDSGGNKAWMGRP